MVPYTLVCIIFALSTPFAVGLHNIGGVFPVWTFVLILSTIIAMVVACMTDGDKQPLYHCVSSTH